MSNVLRKLKRQRKQASEPIKREKPKKLQTKQAMKYQCRACGRSWKMWLQTGLEEHGENHKPVPFAIQCKSCGSPAFHVDCHEDIELDEPIDITEEMNYFANVSDCDCGQPVYR